MPTFLLRSSASLSPSHPGIFPSRPSPDPGTSRFPQKTSLFRGSVAVLSRKRGGRKGNLICVASHPRNLDHIPKQFREENLKEGLKENFKNVPSFLYGLPPSQMNMFMTGNRVVEGLSQRVTEDSISANGSYREITGMSTAGLVSDPMCSAYYERRGRRRRQPPPDLPSILLDHRIVYLGLPIVPAVSELIVAEFIYLEYDNPYEPIYLYIHSHGITDENMELVGSDSDAFAIADVMQLVKPKVYTINLAFAKGYAGMLLALGEKGYRALQPSSSVKLYLPTFEKSSGYATEMFMRGKELDITTNSYLEYMSKGTGKSKEELAEDLKFGKFLLANEAVEYGLADRVINTLDGRFLDPKILPLKKWKLYQDMEDE